MPIAKSFIDAKVLSDKCIYMPPLQTLANALNEILTVQEVADYLRLKKETIWAACRSGKMPHIKFSDRCIRIRRDDLEMFLRTATY